jgi:DNA polymerase
MDAAARRDALVEVYNRASACELCPLHETRGKVVFGSGNADADLMFVGEAPGAEEDRQGLPFVGRAGKLLEELLEGIGMKREGVFIANVLKCRPPGNRDPQPNEIDTCRPYLEKQVELIRPKVIGTLGNFATKLLTGSPIGITKVRGTAQQHTLGGRRVLLLPLFHPAAGLRTPAVADQLRQDFELIPELLEAPVLESVDDALREVEHSVPDSAPSGGEEFLSGSGLPPRQSAADAAAAPDPDQLGLFGGSR